MTQTKHTIYLSDRGLRYLLAAMGSLSKIEVEAGSIELIERFHASISGESGEFELTENALPVGEIIPILFARIVSAQILGDKVEKISTTFEKAVALWFAEPTAPFDLSQLNEE